ncbi:MAG TPA: hypothetical protein VKK79_06700 [Candidatus Lokiarchaeia archaeon]|nr:hypothetical protein [Candidatus Lokiarchaeia archaeon]
MSYYKSNKSPIFKVVIFGDNEKAKGNFVKHIAGHFNAPSGVGVEFFTEDADIDGERAHLQLWDVGTSERSREMWPTCVLGARGGIFVYDVSLPESFAGIDVYLRLMQDKLGHIPVAIVGMKKSEADEVLVAESTIAAKVQEYDNFDFFQASVTTREEAKGVTDIMARRMLQQYREGEN